MRGVVCMCVCVCGGGGSYMCVHTVDVVYYVCAVRV